jgi:hypothetical protein
MFSSWVFLVSRTRDDGVIPAGLLMALVVAYIAKAFIKIKRRAYSFSNYQFIVLPGGRIYCDNGAEGKDLCVRCRPCDHGHQPTALGTSSFGPSKRMKEVEDNYARSPSSRIAKAIRAAKEAGLLENSYAGILGKI